MSATERWLPVVGCEGVYEVSDHGRVRSLTREIGHNHPGFTRTIPDRLLSPAPNASGYPCVNLTRNGRSRTERVHRLVAFAFIGPPPTPLHEVAHGDGTRTNAHADNLRWATRRENIEDTIGHGTLPRGERHYNAKLTWALADEIRSLAASGVGTGEISRRIGISRQSARDVVAGRTWVLDEAKWDAAMADACGAEVGQ